MNVEDHNERYTPDDWGNDDETVIHGDDGHMLDGYTLWQEWLLLPEDWQSFWDMMPIRTPSGVWIDTVSVGTAITHLIELDLGGCLDSGLL